jgi:hypothetical protein
MKKLTATQRFHLASFRSGQTTWKHVMHLNTWRSLVYSEYVWWNPLDIEYQLTVEGLAVVNADRDADRRAETEFWREHEGRGSR